ncbi:MAG: PIN domain-containing protein [Coriobacteriales bacterium]
MKSLLFDANALLYWVYPSSPFHDDVSNLLHAAFEQEASCYALSSSLNEIYYALHSHYMSEGEARASIRDIAETFDLIDLTGLQVFAALDSDEPDYEDGLIRSAAEALQVDAIISYDKKAFRKSFVPKMTAREAVPHLS